MSWTFLTVAHNGCELAPVEAEANAGKVQSYVRCLLEYDAHGQCPRPWWTAVTVAAAFPPNDHHLDSSVLVGCG